MLVVDNKRKGLRKHPLQNMDFPLKDVKDEFGQRRRWQACSSQVLHKRALWYPIAQDL